MYGEVKYLSSSEVQLHELRAKADHAVKCAANAIACRDIEKAGHTVCAGELHRQAVRSLEDFVSYYRHCLDIAAGVKTNSDIFLSSLIKEDA